MTKNSPFLDLARKQVDLFQNDNVGWMETLITSDCIKSIMELGYKILVRDGKITAIEKMDQAEKESLWNSAGEFAKGRLGREDLVRVCRGLVALEYFLT